MAKIKFTRRILEDLELAAQHIAVAKGEIKIAEEVIDRAVIRELRTRRRGEIKKRRR